MRTVRAASILAFCFMSLMISFQAVAASSKNTGTASHSELLYQLAG